MLCEKCGSKLDATTGLCPNCDAAERNKQLDTLELAEKSAAEQTEAPEDQQLSKRETRKCRKNQKLANLTVGQKVIRAFFKTLLCLIAVVVLIGGSIAALVYYDVLDIPAIEDYLVRSGIEVKSTPAFTKIGESYVPNPENVVYFDEYQSYGYVNNVLLVFFNSDASDEDVANVVEKMNGTIVGRIDSLNQYQIQIEPMEYDDLYAYSQEVSKYDGVNYAQIDSIYSFVLNNSLIPFEQWLNIVPIHI